MDLRLQIKADWREKSGGLLEAKNGQMEVFHQCADRWFQNRMIRSKGELWERYWVEQSLGYDEEVCG